MLTVIEGEYMELLLCLPLEQMALGLKVEPLRWRETGGKEHRAGALLLLSRRWLVKLLTLKTDEKNQPGAE